MTNLASALRRVAMFDHVTLLKNCPAELFASQFYSTNDGERQFFAKTGSVKWQNDRRWVFPSKLSRARRAGQNQRKERLIRSAEKYRRLCTNGKRGNGKRNLLFKCPLFKGKYIKCPIPWDWYRNFCPLNRGAPYSEVSLNSKWYDKISLTMKTLNTAINFSWEFLLIDKKVLEFVCTVLYVIYKFL